MQSFVNVSSQCRRPAQLDHGAPCMQAHFDRLSIVALSSTTALRFEGQARLEQALLDLNSHEEAVLLGSLLV